MTTIRSIKQDGNDQQNSEDNPPDFFPADTDAASDVKHDGNKTNYANQVPVTVGDEEE